VDLQSEKKREELVFALKHLHDCGYVLGDARCANAIDCGRAVGILWIDLRDSQSNFAMGLSSVIKKDYVTLLHSIYHPKLSQDIIDTLYDSHFRNNTVDVKSLLEKVEELYKK